MMRTLQSRLAVPVLRPYVRAFAQRSAHGSFDEQAMPAYLETVIHFDFGDFLLSGRWAEAWRPPAEEVLLDRTRTPVPA